MPDEIIRPAASPLAQRLIELTEAHSGRKLLINPATLKTITAITPQQITVRGEALVCTCLQVIDKNGTWKQYDVTEDTAAVARVFGIK